MDFQLEFRQKITFITSMKSSKFMYSFPVSTIKLRINLHCFNYDEDGDWLANRSPSKGSRHYILINEKRSISVRIKEDRGWKAWHGNLQTCITLPYFRRSRLALFVLYDGPRRVQSILYRVQSSSLGCWM